MAHHGQVDIVELAEFDKLGLSSEEFQLSLAAQRVAVFYLDVFLGGNGDEGKATAERRQHVGLHQANGGAHQHADLAVMAACVGCTGIAIGVWVLVDDERVQFAKDGQCRTRTPADEVCTHPGHCQSDPGGHPQFGELPGYRSGGTGLSESGLGIGENVLCQGHQLVRTGIYGLCRSPLQLIP